MKVNPRLLLVATLVLVGGCTAGGGTRSADSIEIKDVGDRYSLSVPVSRLTMTLPKSNWFLKDPSIGGSPNHRRYFYFENKKEAGLILSGWFEPDRLFKGIRNHWEQDTQSWKKQGLPEPTNVSFEKLGGWDTVMYDHNLGNAVSSHLRAHWVQAGTWIELHLSTTTFGSSAENRKRLKSLLGGVSVAPGGGG